MKLKRNIKKLEKFREIIRSSAHLEPKNISNLIKLLKKRNKSLKTNSKLIPLNKVKDWKINHKGNIFHKSGQFFSIEGVRTTAAANREVATWDQPILNQKHGGILAIIAKISKKEGVKFLLRLRIEPGDDGKLKFCPTFQATISNINKAHGGNLPLFHEEVFSRKKTKIIYFTYHGEEGGRFWKKNNLNLLLLVNEKNKIEEKSNDCVWLSLNQIKKLALKDKIVNPFVKTILFMI